MVINIKKRKVSQKSIEALIKYNHKSKRFLGGKHTKKAKEKISESLIGNKRALGMRPNKTSFKKNQEAWNKGKKLGENHKEKLKGKRPNFIPWNKGIRSPLNNEKHWNWKGGITKFHRRVRLMPEYFNWRSRVLLRDNHSCVKCGSKIRLEADHKIPFFNIIQKYKIKTLLEAQKCKKLWDLNNGQTLCIKCHKIKGRHGYKSKKL